jgi:hypothetical protein
VNIIQKLLDSQQETYLRAHHHRKLLAAGYKHDGDEDGLRKYSHSDHPALGAHTLHVHHTQDGKVYKVLIIHDLHNLTAHCA